MLIVCPNCATSYDVDVASLRPDGRRVRCVRCRTIWHAELSHADKLLAAADALAPVRRTVEAVAEAAGAGPEIPTSVERFETASEEPADSDGFGAADSNDSSEIAASAEEFSLNDSPVVESPPIAPDDADLGRVPAGLEAFEAATDSEYIAGETVAAEPRAGTPGRTARHLLGRIKPGRWGWSLSRLQCGILALIIVDAIVVGWRADFVRLMPQTASFYAALGLPVNLRGLAFDGIATTTEQHEGVPILVVEGTLVNESRKLVDVPHLRFSVRNAAHQEVYSWTAVPPRNMLPSGEAVSFHTRLA
jgi:predicted Zn finger-like uncharacterized protein